MNNIKGFNISKQQKIVWDQQKKFNTTQWSRCLVELKGELDQTRLEQSFREVILHNEILLTKFVSAEGLSYPLQVLNEAPSMMWRNVENSTLVTDGSSEYKIEGIETLFSYDETMTFAELHLLTPEKALLFLQLPSLILDTASLNNLIEQIMNCYHGQSLEEDVVQYIDYAEWQAEIQEDKNAGTQYWSDKTLTDIRFPGEQNLLEQHNETVSFSKTINNPQRIIDQDYLLACWASLLHRFSGAQTLSFYYSLDGRVNKDFESALGQYANQVPIQIEINDDELLGDVLSSVKDTVKEAGIYQMDFFGSNSDEIMNAVGFEYSQTMSKSFPDGLCAVVKQMDSTFFQTKLMLSCKHTDTDLQLILHFQSGRFSHEFVSNLLDSLVELVSSAALEQQVQTISLLSSEQRQALLVDFNETSVSVADTLCVYQQFEQQVMQDPDAIAVKSQIDQLSYRQLNDLANQLAHKITVNTSMLGKSVAVCLNRSTELLTTLLGVMKSGASYIAIDPGTPIERVKFMTQDVELMITDSSLVGTLDFLEENLELIVIDHESLSEYPAHNPNIGICLEQTAYVLYTSGSTGLPKGVEVSHKGLANYLQYATKTYLSDVAGALVHTSIAFDLTVTCLYAPLLVGKYVELVDDSEGIDGLQRYLTDNKDKLMVKMTPSHLKALKPWISSLGDEDLALSVLVVGGEALANNDLKPWFERLPSLRVFNEYGPTETTVGCCVYQVKPADDGTVSIGSPIDNTQLYVLDKARNPVPPWVVGELFIGGDGVAKGYRNRADITAECFIDDPFDTVNGNKLYKTGDLVRFINDGRYVLEFLGRNDQQVKVRGYRIELDEIQSVIASLEDVKNVVVSSEINRFDEVEIIAYLVGSSELTIDTTKQQLKKCLSDYMIPAYFHLIDEIPLTTNGKADLKKLASLYVNRWESQQNYVAPVTSEEIMLAECWKQALNIDEVGIHDNFFELGGDSIRGVHAVALAKEAGYEHTMQDLFQIPTIYELAKKCIALQLESSDELDKLLAELENMSEQDALIKLEELTMKELA
jgi:amino acid adenylation domain-containing protein